MKSFLVSLYEIKTERGIHRFLKVTERLIIAIVYLKNIIFIIILPTLIQYYIYQIFFFFFSYVCTFVCIYKCPILCMHVYLLCVCLLYVHLYYFQIDITVYLLIYICNRSAE